MVISCDKISNFCPEYFSPVSSWIFKGWQTVQNVGMKKLGLKFCWMYLSAYIISAFFGGDLISNDCLILTWWMAVCQVCVLWFHLELASSLWGSFSISAFKADHVWVWEMIRDGLMLCCALRKSCLFWHLISTNTNRSGEPQPFSLQQNLSPC